MKKKFLSIFIALVLALSLSLVTATPVSAATLNVPDPYPTIQAAINAANPGDTLIVADGTYNEKIVVDKSLTIQAAASAAIIDGGGALGPGVRITAIDVTFQGFTVTNFTCDPWLPEPNGQSGAGMGAIWATGDGVVISDNTINNIRSTVSPVDRPIMWPAGIGIDVAASDVEVTGNLVHDVDSIGIRVRSDYEEEWTGHTERMGILVENNTVYNTVNTCFVVAGKVTGVTIKGNEIYDSLEPNPYSLWILAHLGGVPSNITVEGNTISGGYVNVRVWGANNINILGNTITDFVKGGIVVKDTLSVQIEGNTISTTVHSEAPNGIQIYPGDGTTGTIKDNQVSGCSWDGYDPETTNYEGGWTGSGILVIDTTSALEISGNGVQGCDVGLDIEAGSLTFMENNDVHENSYGFVLWNADPTINFNNIFGNSVGGVYRAADGDLADILDAENNWWGHASGPYHPTTNHTGTGDEVSDDVDYDPWQTAEVGGAAVGLTVANPQITAISVSPTSIDFGTLRPGQSSGVTPLTISNIGTVDVGVTTSIMETGRFFADNLWLGAVLADTYTTDLDVGGADATPGAKVDVPSTYSAVGEITGTLIFWAEMK